MATGAQTRSIGELLGRLGKESVVYGLLTAASSFASLLALPFLTAELAPPEYGAVALALVLVGLLAGLSSMGLDFSAARWFYDYDSRGWRNSVVATWFWTQIVVSLLLGAALAVAAPWIAALVGLPADGTQVLLLSAVLIPLAGIKNVAAGWFRFRRQPLRAAAVLGGGTVVSVVGMVTFVVLVPWGAAGAMFGQALAGLLIAVACLVALGRSLSIGGLSASLLTSMLRFGLPLLPGVLAAWIVASSDRIILGMLKGADDVGLYALAASVAFSIALLTAAVRMAWAPFVYSMPEDEFSRSVIAQGTLWILWCGFFAAALLSALAPAVVGVLAAPSYTSASGAVPILAFAEVTVIMAAAFATGAGIARKPLAITISVTVAACLNIGLNFALIPSLGYLGAAWATLAAGLAAALVVYGLSQRLYRIDFPRVKLVVIGLVAVGLATASQFCPDSTVAGNAVRVAIVSVMLIVPLVVGMVPRGAIRSRMRGQTTREEIVSTLPSDSPDQPSGHNRQEGAGQTQVEE